MNSLFVRFLAKMTNIFSNLRFSVFGMMNKVCKIYLVFNFVLYLHIVLIVSPVIQCVTPMGRRLLR